MVYCDNEIRRQLCRERAAELAREARRARGVDAVDGQRRRVNGIRARVVQAVVAARRREGAQGAPVYRA